MASPSGTLAVQEARAAQNNYMRNMEQRVTAEGMPYQRQLVWLIKQREILKKIIEDNQQRKKEVDTISRGTRPLQIKKELTTEALRIITENNGTAETIRQNIHELATFLSNKEPNPDNDFTEHRKGLWKKLRDSIDLTEDISTYKKKLYLIIKDIIIDFTFVPGPHTQRNAIAAHPDWPVLGVPSRMGGRRKYRKGGKTRKNGRRCRTHRRRN